MCVVPASSGSNVCGLAQPSYPQQVVLSYVQSLYILVVPYLTTIPNLTVGMLYCLADINEMLAFSLFSTLLVNPGQQQYSRTHDYAAQYEH